MFVVVKMTIIIGFVLFSVIHDRRCISVPSNVETVERLSSSIVPPDKKLTELLLAV